MTFVFVWRLAALAGLLILAVLSLVPGEWRPDVDFVPDSLQHALAYFAVSTASALALPNARPQHLALAFAGLACSFEFAQLFIELRTASLDDAISSIIGAFAGITLASQAVPRVLLPFRP